MEIQTYSFEIIPTDDEQLFEPFVIDVPSMSGHDYAARRAYWSVFHILGPQGLDPEQFTIYEFDGDVRGRLVTMGGFVTQEAGR